MKTLALFSALFVLGLAEAPAQQLISLNFNQTMTGPAAGGKDSSDSWNTITDPTDSRKYPYVTTKLKDSRGNDTDVSIKFSGAFLDTSTVDGDVSGNLDPALFTYYYLATGQTPLTVIFSGLSADADYNVYIYTNNKVKVNGRNFTVAAKNMSTKTLLQNPRPTYTSERETGDTFSGNYIKVKTKSDDSGNLELDLLSTGTGEFDLCGLQIQKDESDPDAIPVLK